MPIKELANEQLSSKWRVHSRPETRDVATFRQVTDEPERSARRPSIVD
jgi:hypothetical protein